MVLAHGAGAPMDSSFMEMLAEALDAQGIACVRFEFPYMIRRREDGKKRLPDRQPALLESFRAMLKAVRSDVGPDCKVLVGGKSMGGRMASVLASENSEGIEGVACYGYPFHTPGKPEKWRVDHFPAVECPLMVIQGTRDPFGKYQEVQDRWPVTGITRLVWLDGGNHDFQPLKKQSETQKQLIRSAAQATRLFIDESIAGA